MMDKIFKSLNLQQTLFVYEYLKDLNATQAAIRAGYTVHSAVSTGSVLTRDPNVRAAIEYMFAERCKKIKVDADWVLDEFVKMYNGVTMADFISINDNGRPAYDFSNVTREQMAAMENLTITPGEFGTSYKMGLPQRAKLLETIGKHVNVQAWRDQIKVSGDLDVSFDREDENA